MRIVHGLIAAPLLGLAGGCEPPTDPVDEVTAPIVFLQTGTDDLRTEGSVLEVSLRPQGAFGAEVELRIEGIEAVESFTIEVLDVDGETLVHQPYLPTSTAMEVEPGVFVIRQLHVVFGDQVTAARIDGTPALLSADMESSPPAHGELAVTLEQVEPEPSP